MKIVFLDSHVANPGDLSWDRLEAIGELTVYERTSTTESPLIAERIGNAEIVITNKTPISRDTLDKCPSVRIIAVIATGYNVVDVNAAADKGIPVVNVPGYATSNVAQFNIALLLEICSHIGEHSRGVYEGRWASCPDFCYWDYPAISLQGKTAGIIGLGSIGQATARLLKAFGMDVLGSSRHQKDIPEDIVTQCSTERVIQESDIIYLCCPMTSETEGIICTENIYRMKDGVIIINTARGQLVNENDLKDALVSGKVRAAAVDVVSAEPIREDNPLLSAPNCIITPHIAWLSDDARQLMLDTTCSNIEAYLSGRKQNVVNM